MSESVFKYIIEEKRTRQGAEEEESRSVVITGLLQARRHVAVPETLEGIPVRGIAPHAFSGNGEILSIALPRSLRFVGAFAFHNCARLEEVSLYDGISDFHNGVLRRDTRLRQIRFFVREGNYTVMRDILSETDARLRFCLSMPDGEARLVFPGYDYSFAENTMARTIQFSIYGSGMEYRECVRRKGVGWREYDRLFTRVTADDPEAAVQIAADRLLYPRQLAPVYAQAYEEYLRANAAMALETFVLGISREEGFPEDSGPGGEEYARIRLMADRGMISAEAADPALRLASERKMTEVCGLLMAGREKSESGPSPSDSGGGALSLEDW
ncbi:MAG: leucine-rich repeat protein [Eubacteriales bacterium]|nr:leucine-rich repeat protein [Eubacteriales bacterium]